MPTFHHSQTTPKSDCLILPVWEDKNLSPEAKELDSKLGGLISSFKQANEKSFGKPLAGGALYSLNHEPVLLVGLGKQKELTIRKYKQAIGSATIRAQKKKYTTLTFLLPEISELTPRQLGEASAVAVGLASYTFDNHKDKEDRIEEITSATFSIPLTTAQKKQFERGLTEGEIIADSINWSRHLGNTPPSVMTPTLLAKEAQALSTIPNIKTTILGINEIKKHKMGCLLGVSQGSIEEPKFIIVEYSGADKNQKPTVLVGKGITYDSGGLSLKPGNSMTDMKFDMLGAATALGSIRAAAKLGLKKNIITLVPACENMPSGSSYRPDDILTAMNGKTVLVENTDAEGRLILADALCYASTLKPKEVIDFATLTGACCVAIGTDRSGLFSPEEKLIQKLTASSQTVGEQLWRLPLGEEYTSAMKCEEADIKNIGGVGGPGYGGASTAAAFLQYFTDYPWAHIDLSSSYVRTKGKPWIRWGANGFGIETMVDYLR